MRLYPSSEFLCIRLIVKPVTYKICRQQKKP